MPRLYFITIWRSKRDLHPKLLNFTYTLSFVYTILAQTNSHSELFEQKNPEKQTQEPPSTFTLFPYFMKNILYEI